jgi:hypothetical protein
MGRFLDRPLRHKEILKAPHPLTLFQEESDGDAKGRRF